MSGVSRQERKRQVKVCDVVQVAKFSREMSRMENQKTKNYKYKI